jgi:hypothetical protein
MDTFNRQDLFTDFLFLAIGDQRPTWVIPLLLSL